jgi:predicted nucleic acid-binding protein
MVVALLDTNVLFASASARDEYHEQSREIVQAIDHGELPTAIVTNYVVAETLNLTGEKLGSEAANGMLDRLIEGAHFEVEHAPKADFNAAQAIFRQYDGLSFVDASIAAYMDREDIEYLYSFDDDFDALSGITRLDTAENPLQ